jgi:uncharacterized protein YjbI with pentapeptide repeats
MRLSETFKRLGSRRQAALLGVAAAAAGVGVGRALEAGWVASAVLAAVLGAGLALFWHSAERNKTGELGRSIVTGALVGLALASAQSSANRHNRALDADRQAWADRQSLSLTLGLQRDLTGIQLSGRDLATFYLPHRQMADAQLSGADLCRAYLVGANLRNANLDVAALRGASLGDTDLRRAQLYRADLTKAELHGSDLRGAWLTRANLAGAQLSEADLRGAHLEFATMTGANLTSAKYDDATLWPRTFHPELHDLQKAAPGGVTARDIRFTGKVPPPPRCFSIIWRHNDAP